MRNKYIYSIRWDKSNITAQKQKMYNARDVSTNFNLLWILAIFFSFDKIIITQINGILYLYVATLQQHTYAISTYHHTICECESCLCCKVYQWLAAGRWVFPGTQVSSINLTTSSFLDDLWFYSLWCLTPLSTIFWVISWVSALLVEETGVPGENHRSVATYTSKDTDNRPLS